ncbi:hypothetical protein WP8W18C01_33750 [Pseudomonas putida]|uniref:Uncharacterized protein n=1 Tax=Pseudomonas putida TaxID=303 RepID=A0A6S5TWE3_PSEPU|nr:hypothetical protein WP8W18C01_33750 [Pseudomonas putida]
MAEKSVEQMARDTLNALIAGGYFKGSIINLTSDGLALDKESLAAIEGQLRNYYSTGMYTPVPPVTGSFRL